MQRYNVKAINGETVNLAPCADKISNIIFDNTSEEDLSVYEDGFSIDGTLSAEEISQLNSLLADLGMAISM